MIKLEKNSIIETADGSLFRILKIENGDQALIIDCIKKSMPKWRSLCELMRPGPVRPRKDIPGEKLENLEDISPERRKTAYQRYGLIAGIVAVIGDKRQYLHMIDLAVQESGLSKQTIRSYLCEYLVYQDIAALAPKEEKNEVALTVDQKTMRWALNKYYYTPLKQTLRYAYDCMLRERYCDEEGKLLPEYPSYARFTYFFRKTKSEQNVLISRNGLSDYQRNARPLLGDGVQEYAPNIGTAMVDGTVCDIYLVDDEGRLVGRPLLVIAVDANTSLCLGYYLGWEGGVYSVRQLLLNVIEDKVTLCSKHGIVIQESQWPCSGVLPGKIVSDKGREYVSANVSQIAELGVTIVDLPAYRAELKGPVENIFGILQGHLLKPQLRGKGTIEPDFQERGKRDYRRDACLTLEQFETALIHAILYWNNQRIVEGYPYTEEMIDAGVKPYASSIWAWKEKEPGAMLISVAKEQLILTLLPRTSGKWSRNGLKVNGYRYKARNGGFTDSYLSGDETAVAYNPDNISVVYMLEDGKYIPFDLIESAFRGKSLDEADSLKKRKRDFVLSFKDEGQQARIDFSRSVSLIRVQALPAPGGVEIKGISANKRKARKSVHKDIGGEEDE